MTNRRSLGKAPLRSVFSVGRALAKWEYIALVVAAVFLAQVWLRVLGMASAGNPFGYLNYKFQPVGTYVLAIVAYFGTLTWVIAVWRHVIFRLTLVRRLLGLQPLPSRSPSELA